MNGGNFTEIVLRVHEKILVYVITVNYLFSPLPLYFVDKEEHMHRYIPPPPPLKNAPKNPECMLHIHYEYITIYYH